MPARSSAAGGAGAAALTAALLLAGSGSRTTMIMTVDADMKPNSDHPFQLTDAEGNKSPDLVLEGNAQYVTMTDTAGYTVVEVDDDDDGTTTHLEYADFDDDDDDSDDEEDDEADDNETAAAAGGKKGGKGGKKKGRKRITNSGCQVGTCSPEKFGLTKGVRDAPEERLRKCRQAEDGTHKTKKRPKGVKGRRHLEGEDDNAFCDRVDGAEVSGVIEKAKKMRQFKKNGGGGGGGGGGGKRGGAGRGGGPAMTAASTGAGDAESPTNKQHYGPGDYEGGGVRLLNSAAMAPLAATFDDRQMRLRAHRNNPNQSGHDTLSPSVQRQLDGDDDVTIMKNFVVNIRFADHTDRQLPDPDTALEELFNGDCASGLNDGVVTCPYAPTGSVKDHFLWNSHGKLLLESTIFPWVTVSGTEKEYADSYYGCSGQFVVAIVEALEILDRDHGIDFSQFDMDQNGYVDAITVLHSGYGAEWGGKAPCGQEGGNRMIDRIWSHKWDLGAGCNWSQRTCRHPEQDVTKQGAWTSDEGTMVLNYHVSPALWGTCNNEIGRIGVIVHETLHFLGLPDLYDGTGGKGLGTYCTMGNSWGWDGSQHYPPILNPWAKWHLGWIDYTPLTSSGGTYELLPSESSAMIYQISAGYDHDSAGRPKEYLLVENRRALGYEKKIPREGVIVWHVVEPELKATKNWSNEGHPGQDGWPANGNHYLVALLPADRQYKLENGLNNGDMHDVIDPGSDFELGPGPNEHPNTDTYLDGNVRKTGIRLWDFQWADAGDPKNLNVKFQYENPNAGTDPSTISTSKSSYENEDIVVMFDNPSAQGGDKIALYGGDVNFGDTISDDAIEWFYACGDKACATAAPTSGTVAFHKDTVPEGSYRALLIRGHSPPHPVLASSDAFSYHTGDTAPSPTPAPVTEAEIYLEKPDLVSGQPVNVQLCCKNKLDWIAIVGADEFNDDGTVHEGMVIDWKYCCGKQIRGDCRPEDEAPTCDQATRATKSLTKKLNPGDYKVFVTDDQVGPYHTLAVTETLHVSAADTGGGGDGGGAQVTTVEPVKDKFTMPGEMIQCKFDHPAANNDDWLAIYPSRITPQDGKMPAREVADWEYICGSQNHADCTEPVQSATVSFNHDLPPDTYLCYVLRNGSGHAYDMVASSQPFQVVKPPGSCKGWCRTNGHPWNTKCTWGSCGGCDEYCNEDDAAAAMTIGVPTSGEAELKTMIEGGAANRGVMFDVDAEIPLEIRSFSVLLGVEAGVTVKVYTKEGSYDGFEDSPSAWTEICSSTVAGKGLTVLTDVPPSDCAPVGMIPGEARSFYVDVGSQDLRLTPAFFPEGTVHARNNDMSVMVGKGVSGKFGKSTCQRQFNGSITYVPEGLPNSGTTTYPIGGNADGVGSPDDPVDGKLGSDCYCDDCKEGKCSAATHKCENEEAT